MTLVGDPPNIIIGNASKIPFLSFSALVFVPLAISYVLLMVMSRFGILKDLASVSKKSRFIEDMRASGVITNKRLMIVSLSTLAVVVTGFVMHSVVDIEMSLFALLGGAFLLLYTGKDFDEIAHEIDWNVIAFFVGLFALANSLESSGISADLANIALNYADSPILLSSSILWLSGMIAMITGAIPVVTIFIPIVATLTHFYPLPYDLWIALALGSNLGGNGTLTGHLANIMTFEMLNKETKQKNTFLDFFKLGFPSAIASLVVSNLYLIVRLLLLS
jgi:Na+/H+ antiporter NhaD/arsenite permease-like protein